MLQIGEVPYGILYSFHPEYLAQLQVEEFDHTDLSNDAKSPTSNPRRTFAEQLFDFLKNHE